MLFFVEFVDFAEPVHVQLAYEGLDLAVAEVDWQHLVLQSFRALNMYFRTVLAPANDILELIFLSRLGRTSNIEYIFIMNSGIADLLQI